jgi:hypothetical protein
MHLPFGHAKWPNMTMQGGDTGQNGKERKYAKSLIMQILIS